MPLLLEPPGPRRRAEVALGVHDDAVAARERGLEELVRRRQRHAAVAALEDEADVRDHLLDAHQGRLVVADIVRPRYVGGGFEERAGHEGCRHCRGLS